MSAELFGSLNFAKKSSEVLARMLPLDSRKRWIPSGPPKVFVSLKTTSGTKMFGLNSGRTSKANAVRG